MIVGEGRITSFTVKALFLFTFFYSVTSRVIAQTDLTQYATPELFKAKPIGTTSMASATSDMDYMEVVFQRELQEGLEFWHNNQLDDAVHHFDVMIAEYPEISFLYYLKGGVLYDLKKLDEAIESLDMALRLDPLFLESKYLIGRIQIDKKDYKGAKEIMELLVNVPKYEAFGYHGLGLIAQEEKNFYRASRMFDKSIKADSGFLESYIPLTYLELGMNMGLKRIMSRMDQAVALDSLWQEARIIRALLSLMWDKDTRQFEEDIDILLQQDPENYHYHFIRGYLDIELKDYQKAVDNFRNAYNLSTDSVDVGEFKFSTRTKRNKALQSCLNYYHGKRDEIKEKTRFYLDRGICEFIEENRTIALSYYDSAFSIERSSVIDFFRGVAYESMWDGEARAIESYTKSIAGDSMNYWAYSNRAALFIKTGKKALAFDDCTRMIEINPKIKDGYKSRGILYMEDGQFIRAYWDFSKALADDTTDLDIFFNRGGAAFYAGHFDEALKDYNKVIKKKPKDGEAYYMVSKIYLIKQDTLQSIALLDSASRLKKYDKEYHKELLQLAKQTDQYLIMERALDRLVQYYGYEDFYYLDRGKFYYEQKNFDKALKDLKVFVKRRKDDGEGYYYLGKVQIALGDQKAGEKSIDRARKLGFE